MKPTISVIIPVYNVERYLARCLDSALNQTFSDIEVIAIDDGSPDNSAAVLKGYAEKDNRVCVITQPNQGTSVARNNGLAQATGEYVFFLDADDSLHPQALEITYVQMQKYKADLVTVGFQQVYDLEEPKTVVYDLSKVSAHVVEYPLPYTQHRKHPRIQPSICILHRRDLIKDIVFIPGIYFEDIPFLWSLLKKNPRTVMLNEKLLFYTVGHESTTHQVCKPKHIRGYHIGMMAVCETYRDCPQGLRLVTGMFLPTLLKIQFNMIRRSPKEVQPKLWTAFCLELKDLKDKGLLTWRGHKLTRYIKYLWLLRTRKTTQT